MARKLSVVCYAVNGGGVGHLTRLVAIARWMRRYATFLGVRPDILFLTTSEADSLLFHERFASFKLPSKTAAFESGLDKLAYLAIAKQWIWSSMSLLRPDLFVVDTFPGGSFGELGGCLDLCRKKAFVYRPMKRELAERPEFQAYLPLYDSLIVPDDEAELPVPPEVVPRVRRVGTVAARERVELATREAARAALDLPEDAFVVWVSAGGGGDPGAEADLATITGALLRDPSTHLVVAAGPLYRGPPIAGPRVRPWTGLGASEWLAAADVAVSAAGYNSCAELMLAGVPTVFVPQDKVADEQELRAARSVEVGAALMLRRPLTESAVCEAVNAFRDPDRARVASERGRALVPSNGARRAARALCQLVLPASELDAAEAAMSDGLIALARRTNVDESVIVGVIRALAPSEDGLPTPDAARASACALELIEKFAGSGRPIEAAARVASSFLGRNLFGSPEVRAAAAHRAIDALAPFDDWNGAAALIRAAPAPRGTDVSSAADELLRLTEHLRSNGEDLYRGIARLVGSPDRTWSSRVGSPSSGEENA